MNRPLLALLLAAPLLGPAPPGFAQSPGAPLYDPAQLPSLRGAVQQFTLTPRGDIDGFVLADGTEVKTPPHLSTEIAFAVKPGDTVVVHGLRAAALPLMQAASVTDEASGKTVVDNGPPGPPPRRGPPPPPPPPDGAQDLVQGKVRMPLHGPKGDVDGALLDDGLTLRLPPPEAARHAGWLQAGAAISARGRILKTAMGAVLDASAIGPAPDAMVPVGGPPDRGPPPPPPPM